jgi:hypothetical protein
MCSRRAMDSAAINTLIKNSPLLKHKFTCVFAADNFPRLSNNTFQIVNNQRARKSGQHWIVLARRNNKMIFADSLGKSIRYYPKNCQRFSKIHKNISVHQFVNRMLQNSDYLCGAFCFCFAHVIFL